MDLQLDPSDEAFAAETARFLANEATEFRRDPSLLDGSFWKRCAELGWFGLSAAADHGAGFRHEALLAREIGRALLPGPYIGTLVGARLASTAGFADIADDAMGGSIRIAVAQPTDDGAAVDDRGRLTGRFLLLDSAEADLAVVASPVMCALVAVDEFERVATQPCIDGSVGLATAETRGAPVVLSVDSMDEPMAVAGAVVAAALVGIAEATRDTALVHATTRVQFRRPIGVNQAVKHACADMALRAEAAWAQTIWAAAHIDESTREIAFHAAAAKSIATGAALDNAAANIQVHGALGFSWECDAHRYLKRARVYDQLFGGRRTQLERCLAAPRGGADR